MEGRQQSVVPAGENGIGSAHGYLVTTARRKGTLRETARRVGAARVPELSR
jgi:hypothetical protein